MALLTDKYTTKTLENRLNEFSEYGMTLYYLFEEGRTNLDDLSNLFFSKDDDKTIFTYGKIMKKMNPNDLNDSFLLKTFSVSLSARLFISADKDSTFLESERLFLILLISQLYVVI